MNKQREQQGSVPDLRFSRGTLLFFLAVLLLPPLAGYLLAPLLALYTVALITALLAVLLLLRRAPERRQDEEKVELFPEPAETKPPDSEIRRRLMRQGKKARDDADAVRRQFAFLEEASDLLASSLDYEATLASVAQLIVPRMADWCSVYIAEEEGGLRQLAVAHTDPARVEMARELGRRYPPDPNAPRGIPHVLRTGRAELTSQVTDEMLVQGARDEAHLKLLRALGIRSVMMVPLIARGRPLGVLTFATAESEHSYGAEDLSIAEELAHRAALAVDNARLYREARESAHRREELIRQLSLLVEASGSLTQKLELSSVLAAILNLSSRLIAADAHAVWRRFPDGVWKIVDASGLSQQYLRDQGRTYSANPRPLEAPVVAEDVQALPMLEERQAAYRLEGIQSLLAAPLSIHGDPAGTLVFYYRRRHRLDEVTVRLAMALANLSAAAIGTAELYQKVQDELRQRTQAEQALREADRLKDEFLAMLAHELRNPLAPIRTSLHIIAQPGAGAATLTKVHEMMERQVRHMARLLDDLLDVSRITRGKIELRREPLEVGELVSRSLEAVRPLLEERRHQLTLSLPLGPLHLLGDPTRLEQVLVNLLNNACKYTEPGGRIQLEGQRDGDTIVLRVHDNGIGIAEDMLPKIFGLFVQANRRLDRSQGGVGIGLTLVRKLVELHGGTVEAASPGLGQGSTFTVRLPALVLPKPESDGDKEQKGPGAAARPRRVLVVDDNVDAADSLALLLRLEGHRVGVAHNGPAALEAARAEPPEVVLLDLGMPGMGGLEVCRQLRQRAEMRTAVLVAVTGWGQEEDQRQTRAAGFDLHLTKPVALADLKRVLASENGR